MKKVADTFSLFFVIGQGSFSFDPLSESCLSKTKRVAAVSSILQKIIFFDWNVWILLLRQKLPNFFQSVYSYSHKKPCLSNLICLSFLLFVAFISREFREKFVPHALGIRKIWIAGFHFCVFASNQYEHNVMSTCTDFPNVLFASLTTSLLATSYSTSASGRGCDFDVHYWFNSCVARWTFALIHSSQ